MGTGLPHRRRRPAKSPSRFLTGTAYPSRRGAVSRSSSYSTQWLVSLIVIILTGIVARVLRSPERED